MSTLSLSTRQREAVDIAASGRLCAVTGGPGTGKTTVIRSILSRCRSQGEAVLLLAPTGKAAARVSEQTGDRAFTIHKAIGWQPMGRRFDYDADNPFPHDVVIVDESSMIDVFVMSKLVEAISPSTRLVLVGDVDQLPPVSAGSPFRDLLSMESVPRVVLDQRFRQTEGAGIVRAALDVLGGRVPASDQALSEGAFFVLRRSRETLLPTVLELLRTRIPRALGGPLDHARVQVLIAGRRTEIGTLAWNETLAGVFNPTRAPGPKPVQGDKVIQCENDYDLGVFNGDTGIVTDVDGDELFVDYGAEEGPVRYTPSAAKALELAYSLTVHKSQGSEYEAVVIVLDDSHGPLLVRNLLYTGITRAKRLCVVVSTAQALSTCVDGMLAPRQGHLVERVTQGLRPVPSPAP